MSRPGAAPVHHHQLQLALHVAAPLRRSSARGSARHQGRRDRSAIRLSDERRKSTLIRVLEFKRPGQGVGVTVYPLGLRVGPTLGLRGYIENVPDIRVVFDGGPARFLHLDERACLRCRRGTLRGRSRQDGVSAPTRSSSVVWARSRATSATATATSVKVGRRPIRADRVRDFRQVRLELPQRTGRAPVLYRADQYARDGELLMSERVDAWLAACADAERRGLPELKPLLEALARSTEALRIADASSTSECSRRRKTARNLGRAARRAVTNYEP